MKVIYLQKMSVFYVHFDGQRTKQISSNHNSTDVVMVLWITMYDVNFSDSECLFWVFKVQA